MRGDEALAWMSKWRWSSADNVSLRSGVARWGEYSAGGKTGCMLEDRPAGDEGRSEVSGGGVADSALGDE